MKIKKNLNSIPYSASDDNKGIYGQVEENAVAYMPSLFENEDYGQSIKCISHATGMSPIIKWPGGKEKELKHIIPQLPKFKRYFEPFVGGGSVFMGINADEYYINDFSSELFYLYKAIANKDTEFFSYCELIDNSWVRARHFISSHPELFDIYSNYRTNGIYTEELKRKISEFCLIKTSEVEGIISPQLSFNISIMRKEVESNLFRKMKRMKQLENERHSLPDKDIYDNIECAVKSALYMYYRALYNSKDITKTNKTLHCALFFFIRNYAYSGMFRYSSKGDFNVPYGGIAYNRKLMRKKLDYYRSNELITHFSKSKIFNYDFEEFLRVTNPDITDFVFLDPPYDTEFSTYAGNEFGRKDQERLAAYLISECRAKWMLIIKHTDFIYNLYNKPNINIQAFDKEYLVSFMNRNEKKVTHLLITNY